MSTGVPSNDQAHLRLWSEADQRSGAATTTLVAREGNANDCHDSATAQRVSLYNDHRTSKRRFGAHRLR